MAEAIELAARTPAFVRVDSLSKTPSRTPSAASLADFDGLSRSPSPLAQLPALGSTPAPAPLPPTAQSSETDLRTEEAGQKMRRMSMGDEAGAEGTSLPPVDEGKGAWSFCFAAFVLET